MEETLMARKPISVEDIREQIDRTISPGEIIEILGNKEGNTKQLFCKNWKELWDTILLESQFWFVTLKEERVKLLVDTQGYDYPRYAGILEK